MLTSVVHTRLYLRYSLVVYYHEPYESIPGMVKLKQVVMPYIELIQDNNTTNKFPSRYKGYADTNPHLLSEQYHQTI